MEPICVIFPLSELTPCTLLSLEPGVKSLNSYIRRVTKSKVSFDKVKNLLDLVYMVIKDFEESNWQKYAVNNFQYWPRNTQPLECCSLK